MYDAMATSTSSGWNKPSGAAKPVQKKPSALRGIVAGLVVIVLALAGAWYFLGDSLTSTEPKAKKTKTIKEVKPVKVAPEKPTVEKPVKSSPLNDAVAKVKPIEKTPITKRVLTEEEWYALTNRPFNAGVEQLMSWVFTVTPGDVPMPVPPISKEDRKNLAAILLTPLKINEKDSEKLAKCKEQVELAKKEMADYIVQGGDPDDFMQYYFKELKRAYDYRFEILKQARQIYNSEDRQLTKDFCEKMNENLRAEGIKEIDYKEEFDDEEDVSESGTLDASNINQGN